MRADADNIAEIECMIICVPLNEPDAIVDLADVLPDGRYFSDPHRARLYSAMINLMRAGTPPNPATVAEHLGLPLSDVQKAATGYTTKSAREVLVLAEIVVREGQRRLLRAAIAEAAELAGTKTDDVAGMAYTVMQLVSQTSVEMADRREPTLQAALAEVDSLIAHTEAQGGMIGYPTHLRWINERTYGMYGNSVHIITGPPGGRKTTLAQNFVIDMLRAGASVSFFALEGGADTTAASLWAMMATEKLLRWNMPEEAFLSSKFLLLRNRTDAQAQALTEARQELERYTERLRIYDGRDGIYNEDGIVVKARRDRMLKGMDVLIADYLQLMGRSGSLFDRLERATHTMQRLVRELDVVGILLAQLNVATNYELGSDNGYYTAGVKGGGDPEQAADYLYRVFPTKEDPSVVTLELRKARYSRSHVKQNFIINPSSGWVIREA